MNLCFIPAHELAIDGFPLQAVEGRAHEVAAQAFRALAEAALSITAVATRRKQTL